MHGDIRTYPIKENIAIILRVHSHIQIYLHLCIYIYIYIQPSTLTSSAVHEKQAIPGYCDAPFFATHQRTKLPVPYRMMSFHLLLFPCLSPASISINV